MVTKAERQGGGINQGLGMNTQIVCVTYAYICTRIYKTDNPDLAYSTGGATQYTVITYMRKESERN